LRKLVRAWIATVFIGAWGTYILAAADVSPRVLNGIDVLRQQGFAALSGKRVGLITNHTGQASDGTSDLDLLYKSGVCTLAAIFGPEHGIRGESDDKVPSVVDEITGVPVYSLYGETLRPAPEIVRKLDALVFDIQDVGARFYTYATTLGYCLEAAAKAGIPFYVLDRPNPVGGIKVEGPILDADKLSFVGYMPIPVRHGMTIGELARYFNTQNRISADLHVVSMAGWHRRYLFPDTGQLWINPSPNMRSPLEAILYPGVCLLEQTNVSVGRGTDRPFEIVGAPWIEPRRLAAALQQASVPGVSFCPVYFSPTTSVFGGEKCGGVSLLLTDQERFNSVLAGLTLLSTLYRLYPEKFQIDKSLTLLGNSEALKALKAGRPPAAVLQDGDLALRLFLANRQKALLYD
jgi:uncharacterized protein YbbC (DUF1343 family)